MSDQDEVTFREMFPLVIGVLMGVALLLLVVSLFLGGSDDVYIPAGKTRTEALMERLSPVGEVQFGAAEETAVAAAEEEEEASGPRSGSAVYNAVCAACHDSGAAGAPMLDAADDWQQRLSERGFSGLVDSVMNGRGAMPAGGGGDASEEELEAAVEFILEENDISW